jgi:hypothetical protein
MGKREGVREEKVKGFTRERSSGKRIWMSLLISFLEMLFP